MLQDLVVGSGLVALTVLIHTIGLILIASATSPLARYLGFHNHDVGRTLVMTGTVLGILGILTLEVWSWATAYVLLGTMRNMADALYLSTAMFSTVGYGEIHIEPSWRLLTALEGINGFLLTAGPPPIWWARRPDTGPFARASTSRGPQPD